MLIFCVPPGDVTPLGSSLIWFNFRASFRLLGSKGNGLLAMWLFRSYGMDSEFTQDNS